MSVAGVRGAITLAGVLTLPLVLNDGTPFPARDLAIFLAVLLAAGRAARVSRIVRAPAPFSASTGLLTANGRPRRDAILSHFQTEVDASYRRPASIPSTGVSA